VSLTNLQSGLQLSLISPYASLLSVYGGLEALTIAEKIYSTDRKVEGIRFAGLDSRLLRTSGAAIQRF
jgi:hypothetical protein